ncbi:MAG: AAA family ATPase [Dehalococcoidia bacterium]|nr:AAA family ATPase [Dehalococcoidia bacterium]
MRKWVVAVVGLAGSGKSEVAKVFEESGFIKVRFGDITDEEVRKRGLVLNEDNERLVRESLRQEHGMAAYAKLNLPRIDEALRRASVVADGMYSWEEYLLLKEYYGEVFRVVAVWSSPGTRYRRLLVRKVRPLTFEEAKSRDKAEIENTNKGGPIAMADYMVVNEGPLDELRSQVRKIVRELQ